VSAGAADEGRDALAEMVAARTLRTHSVSAYPSPTAGPVGEEFAPPRVSLVVAGDLSTDVTLLSSPVDVLVRGTRAEII
jgi:hypothetical protein